jgi:transcriptional regulator with PAS, ATPase and Fis domain
MQQVYQAIAKAAASEASVVIYGESGTGKELVARTIHQQSNRKHGPFVPVNCGAVPETLFEREFFGHRKGAFTGANIDSAGYFGRAHTGTLFLDEVGELSLAMQVKLLRALQEKEYVPLGDTRARKVDLRILAASNKDLVELMKQGQMREDFFYRLRVMVITVPPLRERKDDIPLLMEHFWNNDAGSGKNQTTIPGRILEQLMTYHWPGNIRELHNELQRYLMEQRLEFIGNQPGQVERENSPTTDFQPAGDNFREMVEAYEKHLIVNALSQTAGHLGKTSDLLGIPQKTLYRKIRKYGIQAD